MLDSVTAMHCSSCQEFKGELEQRGKKIKLPVSAVYEAASVFN